MEIKAVQLLLPSRQVSNDEIVDMIRRKSKSRFSGNLEFTLKLMSRLLLQSGAKTRHWLASDETPMSLMVDASNRALTEAKLDPAEIDLIIYASLYLEVLEPSTANMLAYELGIKSAECWDVKAGCDGWMKAVKMSDALIRTGLYKKVMIVNAEFPMVPNFAIYPKLFALSSRQELEWRFPAFTLGEAVAVTIVGEGGNEWRYRWTTRNDLADLCTATPPWYGQYPLSSHRIAPDGPGLFTSYGNELLKEGFPETVKLFKSFGIEPDGIDMLFTHSSSKSDWDKVAKTIELGPKHFDIYARCGNIVTASMPGAMSLALTEGRLRKSDRVFALNASAGMAFSAAYFNF